MDGLLEVLAGRKQRVVWEMPMGPGLEVVHVFSSQPLLVEP